MFEDFDDPNPASPAPIDDVMERGRRLRVRRRAIAGAAAAVVLFGGLTTAVVLHGGGAKKVVVSDEPTTTTVTDASGVSGTVPNTDTPDTPTTDTSSSTVAPVDDSTTTTASTQPPHNPNDLSMVSLTYGPDPEVVEIPEGGSKPVTYTVTNNGPWTVHVGDCVGYSVDMWAVPATVAWPPYSDGIWPQPYPSVDPTVSPGVCADVLQILQPGGSFTSTAELYGGYRNQAGDLMPSPPGWTSFVAPYLPPCHQPCDLNHPDSIKVQIEPPIWPAPPSLYTIVYKTKHMAAASGQSTEAEISYTNGLGFTVRMPLFGPCWKVKSGTATVTCSGDRSFVVVGPHQSVDLVGTVWARADFVATGAPLAAGRYPINLGDREDETKFYPPNDRVYLQVS